MATVAIEGGVVTKPVGLDFGAVLAMGEALDVDMELLAEALPHVEAAILSGDEPEEDIEEATDGD